MTLGCVFSLDVFFGLITSEQSRVSADSYPYVVLITLVIHFAPNLSQYNERRLDLTSIHVFRGLASIVHLVQPALGLCYATIDPYPIYGFSSTSTFFA
ncbi:hypothetical protein B0H16DRAFT_1026016 [Mycena metata]|uniref:Uncharacterized protein n=1 Tax=Mycena metata TaxID=1033252 RepID=A0AAD7IFR3_9AGAR|nr:hypothetical protein B0H16DRAFT_1026016 [Mycena metata]